MQTIFRKLRMLWKQTAACRRYGFVYTHCP